MQIRQYIIRAFCVITMGGAALLTGGCASIVHGGPRTLTVSTRPAGATATITKSGTADAVHTAVTPFTVSLAPKRGYFKGQSYTVRFELAGYKSDEVVIRSELSGWYWGNLIFGGLVGLLVVDPLTGSMWNLAPDKVDRTLNPQQAAVLRTGEGFIVTLVSDLSASERANLVKIH